MRSLLLSAGILALIATPVLAQSGPRPSEAVTGPPGLRSVEPLVHHPTNLTDDTARSQISPALPQAGLGPNAPAVAYLHAAEQALRTHRLGVAQSSLGRAETAMLNRSLSRGFVERPHINPAVRNIERARRALAHNDARLALDLVRRAIPMAENMQTAEDYPPPPPPGAGRYAVPPRD